MLKGRAAVVRDGRLVALLGRGDWFGELAFLRADRRRTATVRTVTSATVLVFGRVGYRTPPRGLPAGRRAHRRAGATRRAGVDPTSSEPATLAG